MTTVILVIHVMVAASLIVVVLLQRSEGGALGIGGGGGFMTGRSAGNALTKTTAVLAAMFFATSFGLTMIASRDSTPTSIFGESSAPGQGNCPASCCRRRRPRPAQPLRPRQRRRGTHGPAIEIIQG